MARRLTTIPSSQHEHCTSGDRGFEPHRGQSLLPTAPSAALNPFVAGQEEQRRRKRKRSTVEAEALTVFEVSAVLSSFLSSPIFLFVLPGARSCALQAMPSTKGDQGTRIPVLLVFHGTTSAPSLSSALSLLSRSPRTVWKSATLTT
jgi:hypothetical protein